MKKLSYSLIVVAFSIIILAGLGSAQLGITPPSGWVTIQFNSSQTIANLNNTEMIIEVWGAGGGGRGLGTSAGGGGGGYSRIEISSIGLGSTLNISVGLGGAGGDGTSGSNGGTSSIILSNGTTIISAGGGNGGGASTTIGGAGGCGNLFCGGAGGAGSGGAGTALRGGGGGGSAFWNTTGGAGTAGISSGTPGQGGIGTGNGGNAQVSGSGNPGFFPGGGGAGESQNTGDGGSGANGTILIHYNPNNEVELVSPADNFATAGTEVIFESSLIPKGIFQNKNATLYIWFENGTIFNQTTNLVTGTAINSTSWDITLSELATYGWNVLACFTNGTSDECIFAENNRTFAFGAAIENSIYNPITQETQTESFITNITAPDGTLVLTANLIWNGTSYSGSVQSLGDDRYTLSRTIIIPAGVGNVTWFWQLGFSGGFEQNTTALTQQVNGLEIDDCTVNTFLLLNYTIKDEDDFTFLTNSTYNTTANVFVKLSGDLSGQVFVYFAGNVKTNPIRICAKEEILDQPYRLDAEVQYTADDYVTEYHYIQRLIVTNQSIPQNIDLLLLKILRSQEFLITFKNQNFIPVEGALIEITRQYLNLGQFLTVEVIKTDTDGRAVGHFVLNDEVYTIYVRKEGVLLATFENVRAFCSNIQTGDCRINLNAIGSTTKAGDFLNREGVTFSQSYNDTTRQYRVNFVVDDSSLKNINITIKKFDNFLNDTACSTALVGSAGTLTCTIPAQYQNMTVQAKVYVDGVEVSSAIFSVSPASSTSATTYFLAFFLIITIPLIGIASGPMTLVLFVIGLIVASAMVLVDLGGYVGAFSALLWFIIAALILLWKATRREGN